MFRESLVQINVHRDSGVFHPGERGHRASAVQCSLHAVDLFPAIHRVRNLGPHFREQRSRVPNVFAAVIQNLQLFRFRPWAAGQDQAPHLILVLLVARRDAVQRTNAKQSQRRKLLVAFRVAGFVLQCLQREFLVVDVAPLDIQIQDAHRHTAPQRKHRGQFRDGGECDQQGIGAKIDWARRNGISGTIELFDSFAGDWIVKHEAYRNGSAALAVHQVGARRFELGMELGIGHP